MDAPRENGGFFVGRSKIRRLHRAGCCHMGSNQPCKLPCVRGAARRAEGLYATGLQ